MALNNALPPFSAQRPFIWGVNGQTNVLCGPGACDPTLRASLSGLKPYRYMTGAIQGTIAADGSPIVIAAGTSIILGAEGVGEVLTNAGLWMTATTSHTDLEKGGAAAPKNYFFLLTGLAVQVMDAVQRATGGAATDAMKFSSWLLPEFGYQQALVKAVINFTAISVKNDDNGCEQRLGVIAFLPQMGGPVGDQTITNGRTQTPGVYTPFVATYLMGPKDDQQAKFTLTVGQAISIDNNAVSPTSTVGTAGTTGTIYVPVRVQLIGMLVCVPQGAACDPGQFLMNMGVANIPG